MEGVFLAHSFCSRCATELHRRRTVTGICTKMPQAGMGPPVAIMCNGPMETAAVPPQHLTTGGTISTRNTILASWSRTMRQSVVTRAIRMLASGPLGANFFSASVVVSGS
ncbi:hypothetical protein KIN20_019073 [Parelaphostrongylus tenuis]|uniref:Uncharacterized protein n=1 Tax=Parelaphostrongylus tenuis TaxID=148309 RepID=A0AAD5QSN9_PARTN|nr:hypothetical protein KIN20_019073 [Parelaphostrongylus tenuis]